MDLIVSKNQNRSSTHTCKTMFKKIAIKSCLVLRLRKTYLIIRQLFILLQYTYIIIIEPVFHCARDLWACH